MREHSLLKAKLQAIHIHHGLQPQADEWAQHCQHICHTLAVPCVVKTIHVEITVGDSVEARAREARYAVLARQLAKEEVMLTAHQADDQAETLLLQLLRGAGVSGLAAMPAKSRLGHGWLVRPLLAYTRDLLRAYASQANLTWIEDSSNTDTRFDRNFLRHEIMPRLRRRWPSLSHTLSRVASHEAEADSLLKMLAEQDLQACLVNTQLAITRLVHLSVARQHNVLRFWLKQLGLTAPSTVQMQQIFNELLTAKIDRQPLVKWVGGEIRRYHDFLFAMPNLPAVPQASCLTWKLPTPPLLPLGKLQVVSLPGRGLALPTGTVLQVRFRQGGEQCRLHGQQQAVKKLFQSAHIPPWQRPFLPLIYWEEQLVAIPGISISDGFATQGQQNGWEMVWQR